MHRGRGQNLPEGGASVGDEATGAVGFVLFPDGALSFPRMIGDNFDLDLSAIDAETLRDVQALYEAEAIAALVQNQADREAVGRGNHHGRIRPIGQPGVQFSPTQTDYMWMQRYHGADWDDPDFVRWFQGTEAGEYSRVKAQPEKVAVGYTGERRVSFSKTYA